MNTSSGLLYSTDRGATFNRATVSGNTSTSSNFVGSTASGQYFFVLDKSCKLYRSEDSGANYFQVQVKSGSLPGACERPIGSKSESVLGSVGSKLFIYAGTGYSDIFLSTDLGNTFAKFTEDQGMPSSMWLSTRLFFSDGESGYFMTDLGLLVYQPKIEVH